MARLRVNRLAVMILLSPRQLRIQIGARRWSNQQASYTTREVLIMRENSHGRIRRVGTRTIAFVFTIVCGASWAQPEFVPFRPEQYPHRVDFILNDKPLLCAVGVRGLSESMGWANKLAVRGVPPGAAGAVLYQQPHRAVVLSWEHPVYDPVDKRYLFNFTAVSNASPSESALAARIGGVRRNIKARPLRRGDGTIGAGVSGKTFQAARFLQVKTGESGFKVPPGPAIEIWASAGSGAGGCMNWLATYSIWAN